MSEEWVVSADWLADHLGDVRVVDVRDAWEYDSIGHVPGAVNVPFSAFRAEEHAAEREQASSDADGRGGSGVGGSENGSGIDDSENGSGVGMMPAREHWEGLLGDAGVGEDDTLVAYDDTHGVFAARFLVTALYFGHDDLRLLDGDYSAWVRGHEATTEAPDVTPSEYEARPPDVGPFVDADAVRDAVDDPDAVVVDTREPWEFEEGHIPGAVNIDWKEVVDQETRGLKPREEVESLLASRGVTRDERVVLYCNTARRISHTYVVLRWLGYPDVAFYEGSLTEWRELGRPVE